MKNKKQLQNYLKVCTYLLISFILIPKFTSAAPDAPKTSASKPKTFPTLRSDEGFLFSKLDTSWFNSPTPEDKRNIHLLFRSPVVTNGFQPIMTVRIDKNLGKAKNIKEYIEQWMGDYAKLGYRVLGSRPFRHKKERSYVIDIKNMETKKQVRQVVFFKRKQKAVILTCIDTISSFTSSLKECNKIIRSFAWDQSEIDKELDKVSL